jgi:hypothetical protein
VFSAVKQSFARQPHDPTRWTMIQQSWIQLTIQTPINAIRIAQAGWGFL